MTPPEQHPGAVGRVPGATDLERLVARSRLIGADPTLVVHGGGNTSTKTRESDHLGRERDVLRIKGSGTDLRTIGPDGFPGLSLDDLLPLRERAAMSDEEMVDHLAHCMVEPGSRRPSIETLLHAFLPAKHVDHTHADAICALTNTPDPEARVREALGPEVAVVPYLRPGFALSKQVADLAGARGVVLARHGLVTWGETPEASYGRTLELVGAAEAYLRERERRPAAAGQRADLDAETVEALLLTLRGLLSRERRVVLRVDRGQRGLADRPDAAQVATAARATPDHVLRIGPRSLLLADPTDAEAAVNAFADASRAYFARHRATLPPDAPMLSPLPRVLLVPGLGAVAAGTDANAARVNAEIAHRSHLVTSRTLDAFGAVEWLTEEEVFAFDYWPLELAKLAAAPPPRAFSGRVAVVTGAGSPLGRAVAARLAADGAHLVLAGGDPAERDAATVAAPAGTAVAADGDPLSTAIATFGGVDLLVAVGPPDPSLLRRLDAAAARQGLPVAVVGVGPDGGEATSPPAAAIGSLRVNRVQVGDGASPALVAEAVAFLASDRAAGTRGATLPVGGPGS